MRKDLRILVVEDDRCVRDILLKFLQKWFPDASIEEARNGHDAEEIVRNLDLSFDLIISDWDMPMKLGIELLRSLRDNYSTPFIMMSGDGGNDREKEALDAGANAYFHKPFVFGDLKAKIEEILSTK